MGKCPHFGSTPVKMCAAQTEAEPLPPYYLWHGDAEGPVPAS
jgi:hypothetical protein